jgi:hypothetical protein
MDQKKLRPGVRETVFPATPLLLSQKTYHRFNVLVGDDPAQVRFAEQLLELKTVHLDHLRDEDVLGKEGSFLYQIDHPRAIELSPNTKQLVGFWSLEPIEKGSAGANALIKYAASLLDVSLDKKSLQLMSDELVAQDLADLRAAIWNGAWLVAGPTPSDMPRWLDPWTKPGEWLPKGVDPGHRLNALYRSLVGFVFAKENDQEAARKFGISIAKFKVLQSQNMDLGKVERSIRELSKWRSQKSNPLVCALKIRHIWESQ